MSFGDDYMIKVILAFKASDGINQLVKGFYNEFKRKAQSTQICEASQLWEIEKILNEDSEYNILIFQEDLENHSSAIREEYLNNIRSKFPKLNIVYIINYKYCKSI